jgi:hypothetical protein
LVALLRHHQRQTWVGEVVINRLGGDLMKIAKGGSFGHPPGLPQSGPVPGLPEWEYYFHGRGSCLTHRITGESIDVDFFDDCADYFDTWFFEQYLKSLRSPEPAEQRLLELYPSLRPMHLTVSDLLKAGMLIRLDESHAYRLSDDVLQHSDTMASFCKAWEGPSQRLWLAALVGDWPAAHEAAAKVGNPTLVALTEAPADRCRELRRKRLLQAFRQEDKAPEALRGLADVAAPELRSALEEALSRPLSGLTSAALEIIDQLADPAWSPSVYHLFQQADPEGQIPLPYLWMNAVKFLIRHDYAMAEVLASLPRATGAYAMAEACLLALEHAPELALPLIRRALLSQIPVNRTRVAATLAIIDQPWSRRELLAALRASRDQEVTADSRAALLECRDEEGHRAVAAWEQQNPHEAEPGHFLEIDGNKVGPFTSMRESMLRNRPARIRHEMEQLHDRVMRIPNRIPPEPPYRPWWRFWRRA